MRTLGRGKTEKEAVSGALQWSRGEAPNAALRLSPTFAADNGQRMKPHAVSVTINARAKPHAAAPRMLSKSPLGPSDRMGRFIPRTEATRQRAESSMQTMAPEARTDELASGAAVSAIPRPHLAKRQSAYVADWSPLCHVSVRVRALRPKGGCEQRGAKRIPPSRH